MGKEETAIQRELIDYLKKRDIFCARIPAGGWFHGVYLGDNVGAPDIIMCLHRRGTDGVHKVIIEVGKLVGIEVKTPEGEQRGTQRKSQKLIEACGGEYWIIRSLDELKEKLGDAK